MTSANQEVPGKLAVPPCTAVAFSKFPVNRTPLVHCFEFIELHCKRCQERDSFKRAYGDGGSGSGVAVLVHLKNA